MKGLVWSNRVNTGPLYATFDLTKRCNLKCQDCQYHSPLLENPARSGGDLLDIPLLRFESLCQELSKLGTNQLVLTGEGEPFLHPKLFELLHAAKKAGFHLILFTNGTLLDRDRITSLVESGLDILKVSLWANSAEEYQHNCPGTTSGAFKKIIDNLKLFKEVKKEKKIETPCVVLHQPITKQNFETIEQRIVLAKEVGCDSLSFSPVWSWHGISSLTPDELSHLKSALIRLKKQLDVSGLKHNLKDTLLRYKIGEAVWDKMPCYIAWYHARFRTNGEVYPCQRCNVPLGNLNQQPFSEIWNGEAFQRFRKITGTKKGLRLFTENCDCRFCCYALDNRKIHQIVKWIAPFQMSRERIQPTLSEK